jgi:hypothetical protein
MKTSILNKLDKVCSRFPESTRIDQGDHASFVVRKKVFAYFLNNHHGDGIVGIACKALPGDNKRLVAADPARFYMPAYVGPRGWVGLRLDVARVDWDEVAEVVLGSYLLTAPKTLARTVHISE